LDLAEELGRQVRTQRARLNLSQRETAELLGVSVRALQTWEAGEAMPHPKHRRTLKRFLEAETIKVDDEKPRARYPDQEQAGSPTGRNLP